MKKLITKIWNKCKDLLLWVWAECKDWKTLALLGFICVVIGLPVWGGVLLGLLFHWEWAYAVAAICWAFWMLPGAPFFAMCVSITLIIKRLYEKNAQRRQERRQKGEVPSPQTAEADAPQDSSENQEP